MFVASCGPTSNYGRKIFVLKDVRAFVRLMVMMDEGQTSDSTGWSQCLWPWSNIFTSTRHSTQDLIRHIYCVPHFLSKHNLTYLPLCLQPRIVGTEVASTAVFRSLDIWQPFSRMFIPTYIDKRSCSRDVTQSTKCSTGFTTGRGGKE